MLGVLLSSYLMTCWNYANRLVEPTHPAPGYAGTVLAASAGEAGRVVTLTAAAATLRPGVYGMSWATGSAMLGAVRRESGGRVDRSVISGSMPPIGAPVAIGVSYVGDPRAALELPFSDIGVPTELGPAPAWYIPAPGTPGGTWAIMVHGLNANRLEPLRAVAAVHALALPILDITYRNDSAGPRSPDGLAHLGGTEWHDLDAAVNVARGMGARRIVLFGWSMGATLIAGFLAHSAAADLVAAVVLDSPVLSLPATMRFQADEGGISRPVVWGAEQLIRVRTGTNPADVDVLDHPPGLEPPTLVIQGTADTLVPAGIARQFVAMASVRGRDVRYLEVPGAEHTEGWNSDPARYDAVCSGFLRSYLR
jgi:pimeloyl-ACP methyl ester carboxylesterase